MSDRYGSAWWPADEPLNHEMPPRVPVRPQGSIPVIVRLAWPAGDELIPGRAIRWTESHVMVLIKPIGAPSQTDELIVWLRARDVYTSIPRRPYPRRCCSPAGGAARAQSSVPPAGHGRAVLINRPPRTGPYRPGGSLRWALASIDKMNDDAVTPADLARELGLSAKTVRHWLRQEYGKLSSRGKSRWRLTDDQVAFVRARATQRVS